MVFASGVWYSFENLLILLIVWKHREVPGIEKFTKWSGKRLPRSDVSIHEYIVHRLQKHLRLSHWCSCIRICNRICHLAETRGLQERQCCVKALKTFPILHNVTVFVYLFYSICVLMYLCNCICERQCCAKALKTFPP